MIHTKGEWEVVEVENSKGSYWKVYGGETSICNVITRNMQQAEANAKLISIAPEMFDLLKEIRRGAFIMSKNPDLEAVILDIDEVLKKATE